MQSQNTAPQEDDIHHRWHGPGPQSESERERERARPLGRPPSGGQVRRKEYRAGLGARAGAAAGAWDGVMVSGEVKTHARSIVPGILRTVRSWP